MAKSKNGVNKSEEVRKLLGDNPALTAKEIRDTLAQRGIDVTGGLIYLVRGKMNAKKRRQTRDKVTRVTSGQGDPVAIIHKVKALATELGGLKKLQALVEVLST